MIMVEYWKLVVLKRYAKFDGRAGRAEFWWFYLANLLAYVALMVLVAIANFFFILYIGYALAVLIPSLAVGFRRLHDTNRSGWWVLISLIPIVGAIILIVFLASEGDADANQFGAPDPGLPVAAA